MTNEPVRGAAAVARVLAPRGIAIVGVSAEPGSAGRNVLANLEGSRFDGTIHLVSRSAGEVAGRPCLGSIDALPAGLDLAVLAVPAAAVREAVEACGRRGIGAAVIFASGFAEIDEAGRAEQAAIAEAARAAGLALVGPNCLGFTNYVGGFGIGFGPGRMAPAAPPAEGAIAIVAQSGAMMAHLGLALDARGLRPSYAISTGNEAGLGIEDFVAWLAGDRTTRVIALFAEHIRRPPDFLQALGAARDAGKPVVLFHPGRSLRAREAARSHTGALAGDHAVMRTMVARAGAVLVESLAELVDVAQLLARFPAPPRGGVGVMTSSGAFCGIALDQCDALGLEVPALAPATRARLAAVLPPFAQAANPLDLTTRPMRQPGLLGDGAAALLADPGIGSLVVAITPGGPEQSVRYLDGLLPAIARPDKPVVLAILGDGSPLTEEFQARVRANDLVLTRSPERALAAVARVSRLAGCLPPAASEPVAPGPPLPSGILPEYRAKGLIAEAGVAVPAGALATSPAEAAALAARIGYPVALKAQSPDLPHKSDAGGVVLGINDSAALAQAWSDLDARVSRARPGLALDGMLVERMARPGLELLVGARRDAAWGPVLVVGLGGVWAEALGDVQLLPADSEEAAVIAALRRLKGAALLAGWRGAPAPDLAAVARAAVALGRLIRRRPEIAEIEINPLRAGPDGATALDALVVVSNDRGLVRSRHAR